MTVSVLLPNYNHGRLIGRALAALAAQTRPPDEIVVVDDASTDDSIRVIQGFADALPQLRMIRNPKNLGVNGSINLALAEAVGDYAVCTAADDWLEPAFVETMTAASQAFPEARLCISAYVELHEADGRTVRHDRRSELGCWYAGDEASFVSADTLYALLRRGFVWLPINGALVHRESLRAIGGFDPALRWHADWFATTTLALRHGFAVVPEPLSVFRVAASTYSTSGMGDPAQQRAVCAAINAKLKRPECRDLYRAIRRRPAALSPFIRYFAANLASHPPDWPFLASLALWWLNEARRGRRPQRVREFMKAHGLLAPPY